MREAESMEKVNATFLKASVVNVAFFCHCYRVVRNDIQVLKCCLPIAEWFVEERALKCCLFCLSALGNTHEKICLTKREKVKI